MGLVTDLLGVKVGSFATCKLIGTNIYELSQFVIEASKVDFGKNEVKEMLLAFEGNITDDKMIMTRILGRGVVYWDKCLVDEGVVTSRKAIFAGVGGNESEYS